jgi:hypothetical protein
MAKTDDKVIIEKKTLLDFIKEKKRLLEMANLLICSRETIRKRMKRFGIHDMYMDEIGNRVYEYDITDNDLLVMSGRKISEKYGCTIQAACHRKRILKRKINENRNTRIR